MEDKLHALLTGAGIGDIIIPRKEFVKEHKNLLKVLKSGKKSALNAEYRDQARELKDGIGGSMIMPYKNQVGNPPIKSISELLKGGMFGRKAVVSQNPAMGVGMAQGADPNSFKNPIKAAERLSFFDEPASIAKARATLLAHINGSKYKDVSEAIKNQAIDEELRDYRQSLLATTDVEKKADRLENLNSILRRLTGGSRNSGFIQRMLGEVKAVHKGAYKPVKRLSKKSTMNAPRVFDYNAMEKPSNWLQTKFG